MEINEKKGKLILIEKGYPKSLYKCECGSLKWINTYNVNKGCIRSCGCIRKEHPNHTKHGDSNTRLYKIWKGMRERCYTPSSTNYNRYGEIGISICSEWDDYSMFKIWALENGYKDGLTIDRIDGKGNYEPSNCRWATYKEQANNIKTNRLITYDGETKTMTQWAEAIGIKPATLWARLNRGWSIEQALSKC